MGNNRKFVKPTAKSLCRQLRSRCFNIEDTHSRHVPIPTTIRDSGKDAPRYPCVECAYPDATAQPYIHDWVVIVHHGRKTSKFRVFLKRSVRLLPNAYADVAGNIVLMRLAARDTESVVNMRSTDRCITEFIMKEITPAIQHFQGPTRPRAPQLLVVRREHAFPGLP